MRTPDPPGARRVTRLKLNSLASTTTTFGSKSIDLTKIPGITRGNVIKTRLDPPRKEPEMTNQDPAPLIARIEQAEHRAKRYKALAETRLETIQRVRDVHKPVTHHLLAKYCQCGQTIPCRTIQALEGDPK